MEKNALEARDDVVREPKPDQKQSITLINGA